MSDASVADKAWKPSFRRGFVPGFAISCFVFGLGALAFLGSWFNVEVRANGEDISRAGGVQIILTDDFGTMVQTCNDSCDDLSLALATGEIGFQVQVRDSAGNCVKCDRGRIYVAELTARRWVIASDPLRMREYSRLFWPWKEDS